MALGTAALPRFFLTFGLLATACELPIESSESSETPERGEASGAAGATGVETTMQDLRPLTELSGSAVVRSSFVMGPQGGTLTLPNQIRVVVPAGAVRSPTELILAISEVPLDQVSFETAGGIAVELSTRNHEVLAAPIAVEFTNVDYELIVLEARGGEWTRLNENTAGTVQVSIDHFSTRLYMALSSATEWFGVRVHELSSDFQREMNDDWLEGQYLAGRASDASRAFMGVGEVGYPGLYCDELGALIEKHANDWNFETPNIDLDSTKVVWEYLHGVVPPSELHGGKYWQITDGSHQRIIDRVKGADPPLTPAQYLDACVQENGGSVYLGMLAAHSLTKEMAYRGREQIGLNSLAVYQRGGNIKFQDVDAEVGAFAGGLAAWRANDRAPLGNYDKMGPLYHIFAAMNVGAWWHLPIGGKLASAWELGARVLRNMGDRPDPEKGEADVCGGTLGERIWRLSVASNTKPPNAPADTPSAVDYLPFVDGAVYTYSVRVDSNDGMNPPSSNTTQQTITVSDRNGSKSWIERVADFEVETRFTSNGEFWQLDRSESDGVLLVDWDPNLEFFPLRPTPGQNWVDAYDLVVMDGDSAQRVDAYDQLSIDGQLTNASVMAGSFEQVMTLTRKQSFDFPSQSFQDDSGKSITVDVTAESTTTELYAPGIGIIRSNEIRTETAHASNGESLTGTETTLRELVRYEPASKK